jgi:hypothetical protein
VDDQFQRPVAANEAALREVNEAIERGEWPGDEAEPVAFRLRRKTRWSSPALAGPWLRSATGRARCRKPPTRDADHRMWAFWS